MFRMKTRWLMIGLVLPLTVFGGEGRNGPDTDGVSAPIALEGSFETKELEAATLKCGTKLAMKIYEQIFRREATDVLPSVPYREAESGVPVSRRIFSTAEVSASSVLEADDDQLFYAIPFRGSWRNKQGSEFQFTISQYGHQPWVKSESRDQYFLEVLAYFSDGDVAGPEAKVERYFGLPSFMPWIGFYKVRSNLVYDPDYGDLLSFKEAAHDVVINPPEKYDRALSLHRLLPGRSALGPKTSITIDTESYRNCLLGELQN